MDFIGQTNRTAPYEIPQAQLEIEVGLSLPRLLWCPSCGVHSRHQDQRSAQHRIMPLCPVCQDIKDKEQEAC